MREYISLLGDGIAANREAVILLQKVLRGLGRGRGLEFLQVGIAGLRVGGLRDNACTDQQSGYD